MAEKCSEPWKECGNWLTRCGVIRPDHKANWPDAAIQDLAYTLRDGVLLCTLLNTLDPGCIDMKDVNQKPQMAQFLCLRNIKTFLQAAREIFGLREHDLFEPSMLFDCSDFLRVLSTLSKLSNCPKVQRKKIEGFTVHRNHCEAPDDPIYRDLNSSAEDDPTSCDIDEDVEYSGYYSHIRNEEIYQDLCMARTQSSQNATTHNFEKRDYVINELVETEKNYVDVLSTMLRCFVRPLSSMLKDDAAIIFKGFKELSEIHTGFHNHLRSAVAPGSSIRLSEVFLKWREKFLIYGEYCANLTAAQARIQEVCQKSELINQQVIKCQQEANNGKFELRDMLMVPMQRILKYHLLLQRLIDETQPNYEDYRGLERAKEAMLDVTEYINEGKRDTEKLQILTVIQDSILDWNMPENTELKDYGRLVKDGDLKIKAHGDQKQKNRWIFIFEQVMLMCKQLRNEQYSYRESLRLSEYKVEDLISRRVGGWTYQWLLVHKTERTCYTMMARTEDLKRKWIKAIQEAMDNIEPTGCRSTDHKFVMHTFDKPITCHHCSKFLKGLIFQGYRCEKCTISMHKNCIPYSGRCGRVERATPPPVEERPERSTGSVSNHVQKPSLKEYLWFVGEMGRDRASQLLEEKSDGTYLLRIRPQGPTNHDETAYALSLKSDEKVKHMKVYQKDIDGVTKFYLSESRFFSNIVELISYYEHTSLGENFVGLDVTLTSPYRQIVAEADFDFVPLAKNQLRLEKGCKIVVLSKEGDYKGWWKGRLYDSDQVGFFPRDYVREVSDTLSNLTDRMSTLQV